MVTLCYGVISRFQLTVQTDLSNTAQQMHARYFSGATAPVMKDIAQDVYLKHLRNFKPTPQKEEGDQVKTFTPPKAPQAPKFEADISADLAKYDAETPAPSHA
ncbi:hypothetical protein IWQ61_000530 [Dispira simplex]|nr:hypothetical protein IWQ61_000530 [Dispira simplex]